MFIIKPFHKLKDNICNFYLDVHCEVVTLKN